MRFKNWDDFKAHCSGLSKVMSPPQKANDLNKTEQKKYENLTSKDELSETEKEDLQKLLAKREIFLNPPLSETAKSYLIERYAKNRYDLRVAAYSTQKVTQLKGSYLETEGVNILREVDNIDYVQPESLKSNDYLAGICDIMSPDGSKIIDVKISWSAVSFFPNLYRKLSYANWWQMQGYLHLYDVKFGQVCYILANTPKHLIDQEKSNLLRRYAYGEIERSKYDEEMDKLDSFFDYNKIPLKKRIIRFDVERCDDLKALIEHKVRLCRQFLNEFEKVHLMNKNIITLAENYLKVEPKTDENNTESES